MLLHKSVKHLILCQQGHEISELRFAIEFWKCGAWANAKGNSSFGRKEGSGGFLWPIELKKGSCLKMP